MKLISWTTLLLFSCIVNLGLAQDNEKLIQALKDNTFEIHIKDNQFAGNGAKILADAIPDCQFVLIGEQHGIREVGQFTKVLFEMANANHDFQYLAIETDPFMATEIETLAQGKVDDVKALATKFPFAIPFYNNTEDFSMLETIKQKSKAEITFWGIDQVFAAAPRYLFEQLSQLTDDEKAKAVAQEYLEKATAGFNNAIKTGQMDKVIINTLTPDDFKKLYAAFPDKNSKAYQIVEGIEASQEIYLYWFGGQYYNNNNVRGQLMKRQFMDYYRAAQEKEKMPKVVFKFGSNHMERGLTPTNIFDIGNMAAEMAAMNGMESLHIKFTGAKGSSFNSLAGPQEFDATENWPELIKEALKDKLETENWLLVDLRPMRHQRLKGIDPDLKRLIFNFDIWVIPTTAHPVSAF